MIVGFSKKFLSKSPFKHEWVDPSIRKEGPVVHHHGEDGEPSTYGHENANLPPSVKVDEGAKEGDASLESAKNLDSKKQAELLVIINRARKQEGLPPVKTLEEGLKTTPTYD